MPKVLNIYKHNTVNAVIISRPSKWGNPFIIGKDGDRDECVYKYIQYLASDPRAPTSEEIIRELRGRDLACYCAPKKCHGDILIRIANEI